MTRSAAPHISVILPTRNRAGELDGALAHLAAQETGGAFTYEVLVVDNGSTDTTRQLVEAWQATFPVPLRYCYEPTIGKPTAANAGIDKADGEVCVFTDDDVIADRKWLHGLHRCLVETEAGAVAGRVLPLWLDGRPSWMTSERLRQLGALGLLDFGTERMELSGGDGGRWWVGSNLAIRKTTIHQAGKFDARFIRSEDRDLFRRYCGVGVRIVYEPSAVVHHKVGKERLTPGYFRQWYWRTGRYRGVGMRWRPHHLLTVASLFGYREVMRWLARWMWSWCRVEPFWSRLVYECRLRASIGVVAQRFTEWPSVCRRYLGSALHGLRRDASIFRLIVAPDAVVRVLGRALAVVSWQRLSRAEVSWAGRIEALRAELEASTQTIRLENYGVGRPGARSSEGGMSVTSVGETCRRTSKSPRAAQLLMAVVRRVRPQRCLELGTSLGISGAYQAAALELAGAGRLVTLEGAPEKATLARSHFQRLGLERASVVTGRFQDTLPGALRELGRVDMAFVDGHHDEHATAAYFQQIVPHVPAGGVLVFDDIEWSEGMRRAWRAVRSDRRVRVAITLDEMGFCVVGTARKRAREIRVPLSL